MLFSHDVYYKSSQGKQTDLILLDFSKKGNRNVQEQPQAEVPANPIPGGREKVTLINVCTAKKQMHDKHKDQLPLPQARWSKC